VVNEVLPGAVSVGGGVGTPARRDTGHRRQAGKTGGRPGDTGKTVGKAG